MPIIIEIHTHTHTYSHTHEHILTFIHTDSQPKTHLHPLLHTHKNIGSNGLYGSHLARRVISGPKKLTLPLLSLNRQDFDAIWHLNNRLVLLEKIKHQFYHCFAYEEMHIYLNLQNIDDFHVIR